MRSFVILTAALAVAFLSADAAARERAEIRCVMHLHSDYTRAGNDTLEELVVKARAAGIHAVIPTDHASASFEWTPFPFAALLSLRKEFPSIMFSSPEKYLIDIARLEKKYPDMIIIPGAEVAADYSWSGSPLSGDLIVKGWHRHMLVVGMEDPDDYRNLPAVGITGGASFEPIMFWPVFLIIAGYGFLRSRPRRGLALFLCGVVLLAGNYPFKSRRADGASASFAGKNVSRVLPTASPSDAGPYQALADYAASRGALTFWAHPEAGNNEEFRSGLPPALPPVKVRSVTEPYPEMLRSTRDYSGFAVFAEGYRIAGAPGGLWDDILLEYCDGKRPAPVWAVSELDYGGDSFGAPIDILQNVLWIEPSLARPTKKDILRAIERGSFYALWKGKSHGLRLKDFYVEGSRGSRAIFGGSVISDGRDILAHIEIESSDAVAAPVKITLIADGKVVGIIETTAPGRIRHRFSPPRQSRNNNKAGAIKGYVRFIVEAGYPDTIATNPVFYTSEAAK
ncbi:MAG: hypothetical protein QME32_05040 [Endomicrobiia bacterium]|nr:hypothetical protein [Endomicrobiia bacterium]